MDGDERAAREVANEERFLRRLQAEDPGGRDVIPVYSDPIATNDWTAPPNPDSVRYEGQVYRADGFRPRPGVKPMVAVAGFVFCICPMAPAVGEDVESTSRAVLPAAGRR